MNIKHVVSFSGGMGSFAEAKSCVDKFGKENVLLVFADTMMEEYLEPKLLSLEDSQEYGGCGCAI